MATQTTDGHWGTHRIIHGLFLSLRYAFLHSLRFLLPQIFPRHGGQNCSTKSVTSSVSGTTAIRQKRPTCTGLSASSSSMRSDILREWAKSKLSNFLPRLR